METILMIGATGLVGTVQIKHFLKDYKVVVTYRTEEKIKEFISNPNFIPVKVDNLLADNAVDKLIKQLEIQNVYPEYLVNMLCDGRWHRMNPDGSAPRECMLNHYIGNVVIPYELSFKLANHPKTRLKKIINISSMYGIVPYDPNLYSNPATETPLQYSLSKCALIHLTKELAIRFKDKGIMVNCVTLGGVNGRAADDFKKKFERVTPLKRMMEPEETIPAVEFLIKENSNYMTGQNIIVDGGRTVW